MRAFKHVSLKDGIADLFERGRSIRIGTFEYYRTMESERRDSDDGVSTSHIASFSKTPNQGLTAQQAAGLQGISINPDFAEIHLTNVTIVRTAPPFWIFCASQQPNPLAIERGEATFEISDLVAFARAIRHGHPTVFGDFAARPVIYDERTADPLTDGSPPVSPFFKSNEFVHENEVRICWTPREPPTEKYLDIRCPAAARFLKRIA